MQGRRRKGGTDTRLRLEPQLTGIRGHVRLRSRPDDLVRR
jgi:hypothetical protein